MGNSHKETMMLGHVGFEAAYAAFREGLTYFSKTVLDHILHGLQQDWALVEECRCNIWSNTMQKV